MAISDRLNVTALVTKTTRTSDGLGGWTRANVTVATAQACRVSIKSTSERNLGEQVKVKGTHKIFVLDTTSFSPGMNFEVDSRNYEILGINRPSRGSHLELDAELIEDRD